MSALVAELKDWATLASLVSPFLLLILVGQLTRFFPTRKEFDQATKALAERLAGIENRQQSQFDQFSKALTERLAALDERQQGQSVRLNQGDARFAMLEQRIAMLPSADQIADLRVALERCSGDIRAMAERAEGLEDLLKATRTHLAMLDEHIRGLK